MPMPVIETDPGLGDVIYPESDGKPMADNPTQARVIRTLVCGFQSLFDERPDMFVEGDFFWYPVNGDNSIVIAPDVTVIADLPNPIDVHTMGSYRQWVFGGHVLLAIEVLSPSNTRAEMSRKLAFYDRHGVGEYWVFDPLLGDLTAYVRVGDQFRVITDAATGWTSPNTGVHITVEDCELVVHGPDDRQWLNPLDELRRAERLAAQTEEMAARAEEMSARAEEMSARAEEMSARADEMSRRAADAEAEIERLRAELARRRSEPG